MIFFLFSILELLELCSYRCRPLVSLSTCVALFPYSCCYGMIECDTAQGEETLDDAVFSLYINNFSLTKCNYNVVEC